MACLPRFQGCAGRVGGAVEHSDASLRHVHQSRAVDQARERQPVQRERILRVARW